jgi:hypothetical protein
MSLITTLPLLCLTDSALYVLVLEGEAITTRICEMTGVVQEKHGEPATGEFGYVRLAPLSGTSLKHELSCFLKLYRPYRCYTMIRVPFSIC